MILSSEHDRHSHARPDESPVGKLIRLTEDPITKRLLRIVAEADSPEAAARAALEYADSLAKEAHDETPAFEGSGHPRV